MHYTHPKPVKRGILMIKIIVNLKFKFVKAIINIPISL